MNSDATQHGKHYLRTALLIGLGFLVLLAALSPFDVEAFFHAYLFGFMFWVGSRWALWPY